MRSGFKNASKCVLLGMLLLAGCAPGMSPVDGKVVWTDGSPATELAGSQVYFEHADANSSAIGEIGPDATFHLMTNEPNDGSIPGKHTVYLVEKLPLADATTLKGMPPIVDPKFSKAETSGLVVDLAPGLNQVTLKIDRAPKTE